METIFDDYAQRYDSWFTTPAGSKVFDLELRTLFQYIYPCQGKKRYLSPFGSLLVGKGTKQ